MLSNLSNLLRPLTLHLTWLAPVVVAVVKTLVGLGVIHLSASQQLDIVSVLSVVGLGSLSHQIFPTASATVRALKTKKK